MALLFDSRFTPLAQGVVAAISALSALERVAILESGSRNDRTFGAWHQLYDYCLQLPNLEYRSTARGSGGQDKRSAAQMLALGREQIKIDGQSFPRGANSAALRRLMSLLKTIFLAYTAQGRPLSNVGGANLEQNGKRILASLAALRRALEDEDRFWKQLNELARPPASSQARLRSFINWLLGTEITDVRHPDFASLSVTDLYLLKLELLGDSDGGVDIAPNNGLLAVIREARGWLARDPKDINLVLRDVLWLKPGSDPNSAKGFYVSSIDKKAFEMEAAPATNEILEATGKLTDDNGRSHRMRLTIPEQPNRAPHQSRYGLLSGSARDPTTLAAWKVLILRPQWADTAKLSALLSQCGPDESDLAYAYATDMGMSCVLFSRSLRLVHPGVQDRREGFRVMLQSYASDREPRVLRHRFGRLVREELRSALEKRLEVEIQSIYLSPPSNAEQRANQIAGEMLDEIDKMLIKKWHLLEPAQLLVRDLDDVVERLDEGEIEKAIQNLLSRENTARYVESTSINLAEDGDETEKAKPARVVAPRMDGLSS